MGRFLTLERKRVRLCPDALTFLPATEAFSCTSSDDSTNRGRDRKVQTRAQAHLETGREGW